MALLNAATLAILSQSVDTRFKFGLARAVTPWQPIAMEVTSNSAANIYPLIKDMGRIREWLGDRVIQNLSKGEFTLSNRDWEETKAIKRKYVEDDTYGIFAPDFEQMGQNAAAFPADQLYPFLKNGFTSLGVDGQYFFDTDHPVGASTASNHMGGSGTPWFLVDASKTYRPLIWQVRKPFKMVKLFDETDPNVFTRGEYVWGIDGRFAAGYSPFWQLAFGSKQTLDATNVSATITVMESQLNDKGDPLKITPTHLIVPSSLGETARKLLTQEYLATGESNYMKGRLQLVVAPELL